MLNKADAQANSSTSMQMSSGLSEGTKVPRFIYDVECFDCDGNLKWHEIVENTVVTQGKNDLLDKYFKGSSYTATWYLGLKGAGTIAAGDTAASHSGWSEVTPYSGNRPAISFGTSSGGSNTATVVSYSCNGSATCAGAFVQSANSGTSGILYSASDFTNSRSVVSGDTLNCTLTVSV